MEIFLLKVIAGFIIGCLIGLTGIGGGSLMTPLLILGFGIQPALAIGTDLLYAALTKLHATVVHARQKWIDYQLVWRLLSGSVPGTLIALALLKLYPHLAENGIFNVFLGVSLVLTAIAILFRQRLIRASEIARHQLGWPLDNPWVTRAFGLALGFLVMMSSVGAGALGTAFIILLYPTLPMRRVIGTDICHAVILTGVAAMGHLSLGHIDWPLLVALLLGSIPGVVLGSRFGALVPERVLQAILSALLFGLGLRLIL